MYFLKEHRLCNQFADAFAKARRKAWLAFAQANPNLPDAEISAQFSSSYSSPESILAAIAKYRTTGLEKDAAEAKKAAKVAYETLKASPEAAAEFEKYGRSVGTAIGEGVLDEGTTLNRDKLLKAFGQLSGGESAGFKLASTGYAAPSAGNIAEGVKPFDYTNAFREELNPQPRFGTTSAPLPEEERQRRIQTGTLQNYDLGTVYETPQKNSNIQGTPEQIEAYYRAYPNKRPGTSAEQAARGDFGTQENQRGTAGEVGAVPGMNYNDGRQRLPSDLGTPQGQTGAITGGLNRTGTAARGTTLYGQTAPTGAPSFDAAGRFVPSQQQTQQQQAQPSSALMTQRGVAGRKAARIADTTRGLPIAPAATPVTPPATPPATPTQNGTKTPSDATSTDQATSTPTGDNPTGNIPPQNPAKIMSRSASNSAITDTSSVYGKDKTAQDMIGGMSEYDAGEAELRAYEQSIIDSEAEAEKTESAKMDKWIAEYRASRDQSYAMWKTERDEDLKQLAIKEANDSAYLQWTADKATREAKKSQTKQIDTMWASLALSGGFGSSNGIEEVLTADAEWEQNIIDLQTEVGFKRTDLSIAYTEARGKIEDNYNLNVRTTLNDFSEDLMRLEQQDFASDKARKEATNAAMKTRVEGIVGLRKEKAAAIRANAKEMKDDAAVAAKAKIDKEKEDFDTMKWAVQTFGNNVPKSLIQDLQNRLPDVDVATYFATPTLGQVKDQMTMDAKNEKALADKLTSSLMNMKVDGSEDPLGLWAARALGRRTTKQRIDEAPMMEDLIKSGNIETLKEQIIITANNSFDTTTRRELDAITEGNIDIDLIQEKLKGFDNKYGGIFKETLEYGRKFIKERDAAWVDLKADIGTQMAETRKKYAGVAVTETELAQLQSFMIDFKFDTVGEMGIKLKNAKENLLIAEQSKFDRILGNGAYKKLTGRGIDVSSTSDKLDFWDDDAMRNNLPSQGGGGSSSGSTLETAFVSGTITGYGSKYWEHGLDVASQPGSSFTTPIPGTVVKVVNNYTEGYPNNFEEGKKQNGGFGNQVVIKYDDGVKLQISHLASTNIKAGSKVEAGTDLGVIGNTGNTYGSTGIHFDITGYKSDGTLMTPREVEEWMKSNSTTLIS